MEREYWDKQSSGFVNGQVGYIAFDSSGTNVVLGCFDGQIYYWNVFGENITTVQGSRYARIKALHLKRNGDEIMVTYHTGCAHILDANLSRENFGDAKHHPETDVKYFSLSADGTCVSELTRASHVNIWNTFTGVLIAKYGAPECNTEHVLGSDETLVAMGFKYDSGNAVRIWNAERPPQDTDVRLELGTDPARGLAFSPDRKVLFVLHKLSASLWDVRTGRKLGDTDDGRGLGEVWHASFSRDGNLLIGKEYAGNATIWNSDVSEQVFDFSHAKNIIETCGPKAHRLWPLSFNTRHTGDYPVDSSSCSEQLNVKNILMLVPNDDQLKRAEYCGDVLVMNI